MCLSWFHGLSFIKTSLLSSVDSDSGVLASSGVHLRRTWQESDGSVWKRKHENMRKPHVIQDGTSTFWGLSHLQSIAINFNGNMQHPKKGRRWDNPTSVQRGLQLTALISANTAQHYVGPCDCQNSIKKHKNN